MCPHSVEMRLVTFPSSFSLIRGLKRLREEDVHGRRLLFLALSERGEAHLAIDDDPHSPRLKVGQKLVLEPPFSGRVFYCDSIHPIARRTAIVNGDRRLGKTAAFVDATALISGYVDEMDGVSVFFGSTPHQPGSWWIQEEEIIPLHERGFVEILPIDAGLLARRTVDNGLYFLPENSAIAGDIRQWQKVYESDLGNILMVERRPKQGSLVLSCQKGLIEVDIRSIPKVKALHHITLEDDYAVLGRISGGAFTVAKGVAKDWGFDELEPAMLLGARGGNFKALAKLLAKK